MRVRSLGRPVVRWKVEVNVAAFYWCRLEGAKAILTLVQVGTASGTFYVTATVEWM